jgi:RNA polymerase sigma factor for flagellar operon FliA
MSAEMQIAIAIPRRSRAERDALIVANFNLIPHAVRKMTARTGITWQRDEFTSTAQLALLHAASDYDDSHGIPFHAFATMRLNRAILSAIRTNDPVPERTRTLLRRAHRLADEFRSNVGRSPTRLEIERLVPGFEHARLTRHQRVPISTNALIRSRFEDGSDFTISLRGTTDVEHTVLAKLEEEQIRGAVARLPQRQRDVVVQLYGRGISLAEQARRAQRSPQRFGQMHLKALSQLRRAIA